MEYNVYLDGEDTGKILRGYEYNSDLIGNLVSFEDLIEAFGGEYTYSPVNSLIKFNNEAVDHYSSVNYSWGTFRLDGKSYRIMIQYPPSETTEYQYFYMSLVDENAEAPTEFFLSNRQSGYYVDDEIYVPIEYAYYIAQLESKMMNFDNGAFNIKTFDFEREEQILDEQFPDGGHLKLNDERWPDNTRTREDFYEGSSKEFIDAFMAVKGYIETHISYGYSIPCEAAKEYCGLLLLGAYRLGSIGYDLYMDYNEDLEAYVVYNKDYSRLIDGTDEDRDKELRLIVVIAYDGKMIYYY
ncbi:MAG: hypothetical protein LUD81_11620 [Clostridiales bacterium]|nr:hypothetical protein [Clostridiales bacterium]